MAKTLFAGPYLGEFGWELMCWQAHVRAAARAYERTIVCSFPGRGALYADFASEFVAHDMKCVSDCHGATRATRPSKKAIRALVPEGVAKHMRPSRKYPGIKPEYVRYGAPREDRSGWLLLHARMRRDWGAKRNWPAAYWHELARRLSQSSETPPMASIGTLDASVAVEHTLDLRGIELADLMDHMASARLVIGPSSGPMHMASLCGARHVVWFGERRLARRYEREWNPLRTPCQTIAGGWRPSVERVEEAIVKSLCE